MTAPLTTDPAAAGTDPSSLSATDAAREIAKAAVASAAAAPPPPPAGDPAADDAAAVAAAAATDDGEGGAAVTAEEVVAAAEEAGVPFQDVLETLTQWGIAVTTDEIPADAYPVADKLLRSIRDGVNPLIHEVEQSRIAQDEVEQFKQRLAQNPQSVLLTLAVTKPEVFGEVREIVERMESAPEFKESVLMRLDVEAREAKLQSQERRSTQQQMETKGRQATALVTAAARRHGVAVEHAERYVSAMVQAQGPDKFDLTTIDSLVAELRPAAPVKKAPKAVTPAAAAAARSAPPPAGTQQPPAAPATPTSTPPNVGGDISKWVRDAGSRVRQAMRGG